MSSVGSIRPTDVQTRAERIQPEILRVRRHLHHNPELSFFEERTAAFLSAELSALGIPHQTGIGGGHGIRAVVEGTASAVTGVTDQAVYLRADMDALPITEATGLPFASNTAGVMHACGHDAHSAMVLGATLILNELREHFAGTVVVLFQPAEEKVPGGARGMIDAGALNQFKPQAIIGQHVNPGLDSGCVGFRPGLMMASADDLYITVHGKGGHAAAPQTVVDPIVIAAQIIGTLQQVVSRWANPDTPTVLSFGRIEGLGATNIIPGEVHIQGTFRTVDESWRAEALERISRLVVQLAEAQGATADVQINHGYPMVMNDESLTARLRAAAVELIGEDRVVDLPLVMWAEDFAYYREKGPACFYNIGIRNVEKGWTAPLHSPRMMVDEAVLVDGTALMTWLALSQLQA